MGYDHSPGYFTPIWRRISSMVWLMVRLKACDMEGLSISPASRQRVTSRIWYSKPLTIGSNKIVSSGWPAGYQERRSFLYQGVGIRMEPAVPAISAVREVWQARVELMTAERPSL